MTDGVWWCIIECKSVYNNRCSWSFNIFWILYQRYFCIFRKRSSHIKVFHRKSDESYLEDKYCWISMSYLRSRIFSIDRKYSIFTRVRILLLSISVDLTDFWLILWVILMIQIQNIQTCIFDPIKISRGQKILRVTVWKSGQTRSTFWSFDS